MKLFAPRTLGLILIALSATTLVGCASVAQTGIRPEFESHTLQRVAVVPFYAQTNFSLSPEALAELLEGSEQAAVASLRAHGFEVVPPADFRARLEAAGAANRFDEGIMLRAPLNIYFEPAKSSNGPPLEVSTLAALRRDGAIGVDALLFGEVVYHTETVCRESPKPRTSREALKAPETPNRTQGTPCVVSHFQAKLVYVQTGETMWFNRIFLESYPKRAAQDAGATNMSLTVARTFNGPDGLDDFVLPESTAKPQQSVAAE